MTERTPDANVKKSGWYPGKYLRRQSATGEMSEVHEEDDSDKHSLDVKKEEKEGWYPGKYAKFGASRSKSTAAHDGEGDSPNVSPKILQEKEEIKKLDQLESEFDKKKSEVVDLTNVMGKVKISLHKIKYCRFARASALIELNDTTAYFDLSPNQPFLDDVTLNFTATMFLRKFPSDVIITINGKQSSTSKSSTQHQEGSNIGVAIIPLVRCFSMLGSPIQPTPQWVITIQFPQS